MPDLLNSPPKVATRPALPPPRPAAARPSAGPRSGGLTGIGAALAAAAVGLLAVEVVTLLAWIAEPRSAAPLSAALRTGAAFWLLGHGGRLHLPGGTAALIPLGLTLMFGALTARAGAAVARVRPADARHRTLLICALAVSLPYAVIAALVAAITGGGGLHTSIPTAIIGGFIVAAVGATVGASRELPVASPNRGRIRATAAAVATAGAVIMAVSALITAIALVTHLSDAAALARPEKAGAVGGLGLLVLQAALAPNVAVWSSAYLLGPGFAVGAGSLVSPTGVRLGDVPALPVLGGLPSAALAWPLYALFLVPLLAGVLAGVVLVRRLPRTPNLRSAALLGGGVALATGGLAAIAAALSGGPVTNGRLATVGPSPWETGIAAGLEVGIPCVLAAVVVSWRRQPRQQPAAAVPAPAPRQRLARVGKLVVLTPIRFAASGIRIGTSRGRSAGRWAVGRASKAPSRLTRMRIGAAKPVVDLMKHARLPVDLTKHPEQSEQPGQPAEAKRRRLRMPRVRMPRLRMPRLRRRKRDSKVIKLPD